jgi:hypothetical protein
MIITLSSWSPSLTSFCRILPEKLIVVKEVNMFTASNGTWSNITLFEAANNWSLFSAGQIQSTFTRCLRLILILSSHLLLIPFLQSPNQRCVSPRGAKCHGYLCAEEWNISLRLFISTVQRQLSVVTEGSSDNRKTRSHKDTITPTDFLQHNVLLVYGITRKGL